MSARACAASAQRFFFAARFPAQNIVAMVLRDLIPVEDNDVVIAIPNEVMVEGCPQIVGNRTSRASANSVYGQSGGPVPPAEWARWGQRSNLSCETARLARKR